MKTKLYLPNGCEQLVESNGFVTNNAELLANNYTVNGSEVIDTAMLNVNEGMKRGVVLGTIVSISGVCLGFLTAVIVDKISDRLSDKVLSRKIKKAKKEAEA